MRDFLLYLGGFLVLLMLQEFVLSGFELFGVVSPFLYLMVIIMLPMQLQIIPTMLWAAAVGAVMDAFMGTSALCSIALIFVGYVRPLIVKITLGQDFVKAGGVPFSGRVGVFNFMKYNMLVCLLFAVVYFSVEMMSLEGWLITLIRILASSVATAVLVFVLQKLVGGGKLSRLS